MTPARKWTSDRIKAAMRLGGIENTQQLSKLSGVERNHLADLIKGKYDTQVKTLFRILEACGLEIVEVKVKHIDPK